MPSRISVGDSGVNRLLGKGQANHLPMQHTTHVHLHMDILKICCTSYYACKIAILTGVKINSSYSNALSSDVRTIQTNTGSSCVVKVVFYYPECDTVR